MRALVLLWLCGICLRITALAIPPVIPLIHESFTMSQAAVGALTSLPVLLFSFAAIPGSLLVARFGAFHVLLAGIVLTGVAAALRGLGDVGLLFAMTFAMGIGIAIMQPALPSVVRDWVPRRIALGTATYSNGLLVGEAISASATIPWILPLVDGSWRASLAVWSVPVLLIAIVVGWLRPASDVSRAPAIAATPRLWWPDWRDPLTWRLGLIAGYASSLYFANAAFLPDYLATRGRPDLLSPTLAALNWVQMFASLLMIFYGHRLAMRRWPFVALGAVSALALLGLLSMADEWIVAWAGVIGFCNAFLLILTLALPPMLSPAHDVHRLSAAMIAIGYLCAFVIPIAGGFVWDMSGVPALAFAPLIAFAALAIALASRLDFSRRG